MPLPAVAPLPSAASGATRAGRGRELATWLGAVLIVAAGLLAYRNGLDGPFVFDDPASILDNPTVQHLWPVWDALQPPQGGGITVEGRPVLNLSLAVNHALGGTQVWGYHAVNLLIHLLAGLTLFGILRRTLDRWSAQSPTRLASRSIAQRIGDNSLHLALVIAALWVVHPLQTESVTYVIQRAESLMGLFYLLTLYGFIRGAEASETASPAAGRSAVLWFGLSWLACLFGMATKEVMATAPVVVFLYDRTFFAGRFRTTWQRRWRYHLMLMSTWILLAALVAAGGGNRSGTLGVGAAPVWAHLLTQFPAIVHYLRLVFWPHPLVFYYTTFWVDQPLAVMPQALLVLALFAGTLWALRYYPALGFLGAWFFLILAPTSLAPGASQMIAEHRMYLPLAAVLTLTMICAVAVASSSLGCRFHAALVPVFFLGWVAVFDCTVLTFLRNAVYRTELSLWSSTVADCPDNPVARDHLGLALSEAGRRPEAIAQFQEALQLKPDYAEAHNNLGIVLAQTGQIAEAMGHFTSALQFKYSYAEAHGNLGLALQGLGRLPEAIEQFQAAVRCAPEDPRDHFNLGFALRVTGQNAGAIAEFRRTLQIKSGYPGAQDNLGLALEGAGQAAEAVAQFKAALQLTPDDPALRFHLGSALYATGQNEEAMVQFQEAVRINPAFAEAHNNFGVALRATGRNDAAISQFRAALLIKPAFAGAETNLGLALGAAGRMPEAIASFQRSLRLQPRDAETHYDLAMALRAAGREAEAKTEFDQASQLGGGKTPSR